MKRHKTYFWVFPLLLVLFFSDCAMWGGVNAKTDYDETRSMLVILTNKVQRAFEQGYLNRGEKAVFEYAAEKNNNIKDWFDKNDICPGEDCRNRLKIEVVDNHVVVLVCEDGKLMLEDTPCTPMVDRDHTGDASKDDCKTTLTKEYMAHFCQQ